MKKNTFAIIIYTLGIVGLIITLFIVYKNICDSEGTQVENS
ncbi:hypothetical protein ACQKM9_21835 [Viridibacillus sp. NPDC093762]